MEETPMSNGKFRKPISRRDALGTLGAIGLAGLVGSAPRALRAAHAGAAGTCSLSPAMTVGPFFVDEDLKRSDIRVGNGSDTPFITDALPLYLTIDAASTLTAGCPPLQGVQIDLWHCHAGGHYSDEQSNGTLGQNWLRGYQVTGADGKVSFITIYPGWYTGRTIHIHLMARYYDAQGNTTYKFATQLYFDDAISDAVLANAPYNTRGDRNTTNQNDGIYDASMLLDLQPIGNGSAGYTGTIGLGLELEASVVTDRIFSSGFEAV
jgi:protocatechuate 3,4-dioxygenase beta subunit